MPAGRKHKNKQRKQRKHKRMLLDKTRRERDEQVNSFLDGTDVKLSHLSASNSFHVVALSQSLHTSPIHLDCTDCTLSELELSLIAPCTPNEYYSRSSPFWSGTPLRRKSDVSKLQRSLSSPATMLLSTIASSNEGTQCDIVVSETLVGKSSSALKYIICNIIRYTQNIFYSMPLLINKFFAWIRLTTVLNSNKSIETINAEELLQCDEAVVKHDESSTSEVVSKLNDILAMLYKMDAKHDKLLERVETLEKKVQMVNSMPTRAVAPPPPPPPPPPPAPLPLLMDTPLKREELPKARKSLACQLPSRPSITLQDILNVQLKKTPKICEQKTPLPTATVPRGPLVSVDMLRSVKLRPPQMRRRSIERPRQTPSSIFKIRSP